MQIIMSSLINGNSVILSYETEMKGKQAVPTDKTFNKLFLINRLIFSPPYIIRKLLIDEVVALRSYVVMSWIRSAINKAAEVPGGAIFRAAVRTYTDTVAQHAGYSISESSTMFQDRTATRNVLSFSDAAKRLEEVSVSSKGEERVILLRKWLAALREYERLDGSQVENDRKSSEDFLILTDKNKNVKPGKSPMILYYDPDIGSVPMNFRDVFLQSRALEVMTMSMILGEPNEEEISLLHEIFGLSLTGGREVHDVVVKNIQDLSKAFSVYDGEMLVRKEELLQFAQTAITGLKLTSDVARIDSEISQIQQSLNRMKCQTSVFDGSLKYSSEATIHASSRDTREFVAHIRLCCRLKSLLLKKILLKKGDTPETHVQKIDKLNILLESLHNSACKTEKRILEHREEQKEILIFRVARTSEVSQIEKDLEEEISVIEKQRDELEAELRKVNSTLAAANTRLEQAREERLQFDEDNNEFLLHLQEKEDELSKTVVSYRAEADTCDAFITFLEATWGFQSSFVKKMDAHINDQLQNHEAYFVNAVTSFLSTYKDQLEPGIAKVRNLLESLKGYPYIIDPDEEFLQDIKQRENLENEYMDAEAKVKNIFDAVESIKQLFFSTIDDASRKGIEVINELCNAIEMIKSDFKTIRRPILRIEIPTNEELSPVKGSPKAVVIPSPGRAMSDFKSIFSQKLSIKSPRQKPYIPLGVSSENSPVSPMENDNKSAESSKRKMKVRESEKVSHFDKELRRREQLIEPESQENKTKEHFTSDLNKELDKSALEKEIGTNTGTIKCGHEKTTETSTTESFSGSNYTTDSVNGKSSQISSSYDRMSVNLDGELPKSYSGIEENDEVSIKDFAGWEFDELVNELKDDHHCLQKREYQQR